MRWLDEEKKGQTFILVAATRVTKKAIALSSRECAANFLGIITSEIFRCHQSWDSVMGENEICCQQETNVS